MSNVGIVIVSHSSKVAEGAADMVRQMVGDEIPLAYTGGTADGALGTDVTSIIAAIDRAWSDAGVAILVDLGGAETNSEMAIEMLASERRDRVVVCNAPIVEGAVVAATEASGGASLAVVRISAEELPPRSKQKRKHVISETAISAQALITNPTGLHARPCVKLTRIAKASPVHVEIALSPDGPWFNAKSPLKVMGLRAPNGASLYLRASQEGAQQTIDELLALVGRNFDEGDDGVTKDSGYA